jgi:hypothetical protein
MKNTILSELFDQMVDIMEILGEDRFRINTYRRVARIISDMPTDVETLLATGQLAKTPGVGKSSLAKIEEFIKTGTITAHQQLLTKIPPTLLELLTIPGVGPKGVKAVYENLKVTTIVELKRAIKTGSVASKNPPAGFVSTRPWKPPTSSPDSSGISPPSRQSSLPAHFDGVPRLSVTLTYSSPLKRASKSYRPLRRLSSYRRSSPQARQKAQRSSRQPPVQSMSMSALYRRKASELRPSILPAQSSITSASEK